MRSICGSVSGQVGVQVKSEGFPAGLYGESVYHLTLSAKVRYEVQGAAAAAAAWEQQPLFRSETVTQFVKQNTEQAR